MNDHLSIYAAETATPPGEAEWLAWVAWAEKVAGTSLDGDQSTEGFSMDEAYAEYKAGTSASTYGLKVYSLTAWHDTDCGGYPSCNGCGWIDKDLAWRAGPCPDEDVPFQTERAEGVAK